jgi:hypothetical protein
MLATYAELQAEIADTLHRDDLAAKIPSFIALFERRANRHLNHPQQEITADLTLLASTREITLPTDLLEIEDAVIYIGNVPTPLQGTTGKFIDRTMPVTSIPTYYTLSNGKMMFGVTANADYTIRIRYVKKWDLATDNTNWLLDNHPDLYLYGSLAASAPFIGEDDRIALWAQLATDAIAEVKHQGARLRATELMTETQQNKGQRFNIVRGY